MDRELTVFVIATIGDTGTRRYREATDVLEHVVAAAAESLVGEPINPKFPQDGRYSSARVFRGERAHAAKDIMVRIVDDIVSADLVVVIVSEENLNVFFEFGIARSANSPVFVLKERRIAMPFDLRNYPYIEYRKQDIRRGDRSPAVHRLRAELATQMRANLGKAHQSPPFDRQELGALGGSAILDRFVQVSYSDWSKLILSAKKEFWLCGLSLWELFKPQNTRFHMPSGPAAEIAEGEGDDNITELLLFLLATGADVTVMMMHPENPALPAYTISRRNGEEDPAHGVLAEIRSEIGKTTEALHDRLILANAHRIRSQFGVDGPIGRWRVIQVADGVVPMRVSMTDRECIASPFFNSITRSSGGPAIRARAGSAWHSAVRNELELLSERQATVSDVGWRQIA